MKHAGPDALDRLEPFLEQLRTRSVLRERERGLFTWSSRAFLHFHEDPKGVFADVRLRDDFDRFPVNTPTQQAALLRRIDRRLARDGGAHESGHRSTGKGGAAMGRAASDMSACSLSSPAMRFTRTALHVPQRWTSAHSPEGRTQMAMGSMPPPHAERRSPGASSR